MSLDQAQVRARRWREKNFMPWEHVVSVSGGKDSTALYLLALERGMPFTAVFADTGNEHEATYEFVRRLPEITGGPPIRWIKADFSRLFERRREWVARKWPEHGITADKIERAIRALHPTGNPFLDLCIIKGRFPGAKSRFCTEELKIIPMFSAVNLPVLREGRSLISWQGVRADESRARSYLPMWQRLNADAIGPKLVEPLPRRARLYAYRPLLNWTREDVFAFHAKHNVKRNELYDLGMDRVGCLPCIMAKKGEVREIAKRFPEHIDRIEEWEALVTEASKRGCATFFAASDDPLYTDGMVLNVKEHGIRNRIQWSLTDRGGIQPNAFHVADYLTSCNQWGACE